MIFRHASFLALAIFLGAGLLASVPMPSQAGEISREEEIAQIEKQIAELTRRLAELKKAPVPAPRPTMPEPAMPAAWSSAVSWRCVGPASMGGRIVAFAVNEADPSMFWIASASGGLLKTTNNGTTFEHQFDRETTVSIGDVAVAPSNPNIVWVGTGEHNPRNSVSYGDGVYKSVDGGKTWKNMGLPRSFQIGRVLIHPTNPDIVYVGALGRLYGPSEERGLYKTVDGGKTWTKILHVDNQTGVIEMKMQPNNPETLLVATWERQRDGFDSHAGALVATPGATNVNPPLEDGYDAYDPIKKWGKGSGIWKTTDGGKNFKRLTRGLPSVEMGRIGLDFSRKNPATVYAIIDSARIGGGKVPGYLGVSSGNGPMNSGARIEDVTASSPAQRAGLKVGDVVTSVNKKPVKTSDEFQKLIQATKPGDEIALALLRDGKSVSVELELGMRGQPDWRRTPLDFRAQDAPGGIKVGAFYDMKSPSVIAGLKQGDIITTADKKKLTTVTQLEDAFRAAKPGNKIVVDVQRDKETKQLTLVVPERPSRRAPPRPYAFWYGGQRENVQDSQGDDGHEYGGVYRSTDAGDTWTRINSVNPRPMYFSQIRVDPTDDQRLYVLGIRLYRSEDGGKKFTMGGDAAVHPDHHAMWIDPRDSRHILLGTDGGTYLTFDRCQKWQYLNNMSIGQFYHACVDSRHPYRIYGGMQDNGSWGGPSRGLDGRGPINSDWAMVQGGDGFVCRVDPFDPDIVYSEYQEGNMQRTNLRTGETASIRPRGNSAGKPYRFNWNTPFIVSSHNPGIFYCAGNVVFRSVKRGDNLQVISPELTTTDQASAVALAESPRNPDVLWVGTDDGNLWVTRDAGKNWTNVAGKVGLPRPYWVATIEPSHKVEGRAYLCFDAHRSDSDDPFIYVTEDYGQTWKSLRGNLPTGTSRVLREDLYNPDVLYLGTEFGVWASIDRGTTWTKINSNLPTVAVHELAQHPQAGEIVAATHGRSLWVADISALRQMKPAMAKAPATLFAPNTAVRWRRELMRGTVYGEGNHTYFGENPQPGAHIYYALTKKAAKVRLEVRDFAGKVVTSLPVKTEPGLHRATWNMRGSPTGSGLELFSPSGLIGAMSRAQAPAPPGQYRVVLTVDGVETGHGLKLENDPTLPSTTIIADDPPERKARRKADD